MSKELTDRLDRCNLNAIIFNQREALRTLEEDKATLKKQNKKLQEQLKEANEILRMYSAYCYEVQDGKIISEEKSPATIYFEKWNVK